MGKVKNRDSYEAMVFSAHLPNHCVAFIYKDGEPRLAGGIYRIERVRTATAADEAAFHTPVSADHCPLCDQAEPE
jgi:hypothetical protein